MAIAEVKIKASMILVNTISNVLKGRWVKDGAKEVNEDDDEANETPDALLSLCLE